jgi:5'-nucleotidase
VQKIEIVEEYDIIRILLKMNYLLQVKKLFFKRMGIRQGMIKNNKIFYDAQKVETKLRGWKKENLYILTDFDRTITDGTSKTSWSFIRHYDTGLDEYIAERRALFGYYRPIECDLTIPEEIRKEKTKEWALKHLALFSKYRIKEEIIEIATSDVSYLSMRQGMKELFELCNEHDIPVIIISAGIGNVIKKFLAHHGCLTKNVFIISNFIMFENGVATGVSRDFIHSSDKHLCVLPGMVKDLTCKKSNIILLGDDMHDIKMVREKDRENALKIGFLETNIENNLPYYQEVFDIILVDSCPVDIVNQLIERL